MLQHLPCKLSPTTSSCIRTPALPHRRFHLPGSALRDPTRNSMALVFIQMVDVPVYDELRSFVNALLAYSCPYNVQRVRNVIDHFLQIVAHLPPESAPRLTIFRVFAQQYSHITHKAVHDYWAVEGPYWTETAERSFGVIFRTYQLALRRDLSEFGPQIMVWSQLHRLIEDHRDYAIARAQEALIDYQFVEEQGTYWDPPRPHPPRPWV
ncbi:hypothetical protein LXA43DRAFT_1100887 [Ganoderma leucocontextum]|nr:hypothetical protein LXA43DRAFT_1100887 [Ganoderma leucocontextum]